MQKNEYLQKISKQFQEAKQKALAALLPLEKSIDQSSSDDTPIPFDIPEPFQYSENFHLDNFLTLSKDTKNPDYASYPLKFAQTVLAGDDELKIVLPRRPALGQLCIIDWLNVTMQAKSFETIDTYHLTDVNAWQNAIIKNLSKVLTDILGFGVSHQLPAGLNHYDMSFQLDHKAGKVSIGGQSGTLLIQLSGEGCSYAKYGWQSDFHAMLNTQAIDPKITRIDLAHDDVTGDYLSLPWFARQLDLGGFTNGGRRPRVEMLGNWKYPDGSGRTLQIGTRKSSKMCRIYEKGRQLGDKSSNWLRVEVELKAKNYFIPLDILINPSPFFLAAYPCFHIFDYQSKLPRETLERIEREKLITFAKAVDITRHQFGRYLLAFRKEFEKHGLSDNDLLSLLTDIDNKKYPDRLNAHSIPDFFKPKATH